MNDALIERWNRTVAPTDEVIVLGDFAMGRIAETLPMLACSTAGRCCLPGTTTAVGTATRRGRRRDRSLPRRGLRRDLAGERRTRHRRSAVVACHFPYRGDSHDHDRYVAHRPADEGAWLLTVTSTSVEGPRTR